jgi:hypothetical protein
MGFRGPEVAIPKPPGTLRIVLLGGSTTHGAGVDDEETIDAHLRRELRARYPGRPIDVVNLGFDAYDAACDYERFKLDGVPLEPDVVILHSGINVVVGARLESADTPPPPYFEPAIRRLKAQQRGERLSAWDTVKHWSYAARLPGLVRWMNAGPQPGPPQPRPGGIDRFGRELLRTAEIAPPRAILLFSTPPSSLRFPNPPVAVPSGLVVDAPTTQRYRDALDARVRGVAATVAAGGRRAAYVTMCRWSCSSTTAI